MRTTDSERLKQRGSDLKMTNAQRSRLNRVKAVVVEKMKKTIADLPKTKNPYGLRIIRVAENGSFSRKTALRAGSDADIVLLMYHPGMAQTPPKVATVLGTLLEAVPNSYSPVRKKRAITVREEKQGSDNIRMELDLVPMMTDSKNGKTPWWFAIDPRGVHRKWVMTSPKGQQEIVGRLRRRAGKLEEQPEDPTALVRVLKDWRGTFTPDKVPCHLPSYVLEVLVWREYRFHNHVEKNMVKRFNRVLNSLEIAATKGISFHKTLGEAHKPPNGKVASGSPLLHDPACLSTNLLQHMSSSDLMWWVKQARKDAAPTRTYEQVFPEEVKG